MTDPIKFYPPKPEKVYFFGTCLIDLFYPDAGMAGIQLLEREGIEVLYPEDQTCCGQPAFTSGYHDDARAVARSQLDLFPENWPIVVPSGSCGGMMRKHYPGLFKDTPDDVRAAEVAGRVWELTDFLLNVCHIKLKDLGEPATVAMHTSCTARREMGVAAVGPALLNQLENVELVEQIRAEECCGFGGTFAIRHPEISGAMVSEKVDALVDTGAKDFVTTDCGCLMNIDGFAGKNQKPIKGQHILSFLWQRTDAGSQNSPVNASEKGDKQ
ncbi:(Fe-S)-binding protein [Marinobacter sp.]|uniref:(Fe-S)-binding protein n=1 Tax=Marinobacter sp. TaxID=50741 RepID=UPI002B470941|nr:(Fe-S)-binding protein [Marinobacter sp.]HKK57537.1 (Fe-S)-binding protein [Marinobacter sp.]